MTNEALKARISDETDLERYPKIARKHRLYRNLTKLITAADAKRKYMNPQLIHRADASMSRDELTSLILHHAAELQWLLDNHFRMYATGQYVGPRVTKKRLAEIANQLHDWWNIADMHKVARPGEPIIWEM